MSEAALDITRGVFAAEADGTTGGGSAIAIVDADAIRVTAFKPTLRGTPILDQLESHSAYGGGIQAVASAHQGWRFEYETQAFAPATKGDIDDNNVGDLWRSCPVKITETGATKVEIAPTSACFFGARATNASYVETATLQYTSDKGNIWKLHNGVTAFKIAGEIGQIPKIAWTTDGKYNAVTSAAAVTLAPTFTGDRVGPVFIGATNSAGGVLTSTNFRVVGFEFDPGIDLIDVMSSSETNGFAPSLGSHNRYATLSMDCYADDDDEFDPWTLFGSGAHAPSVSWGAAGNRLTISLPQSVLIPPEDTPQGAARGVRITFQAYPTSSGNDQYLITMD